MHLIQRPYKVLYTSCKYRGVRGCNHWVDM